MITAATWRTCIHSCDYGTGLFRFEVCDGPVSRPLGLNRKYAPVLASARDVLPRKWLNKAAHGGQATVPCHGGVAALSFNMVQKIQHGVGLNVVEIQILDRFSLLVRQEQKKQLQRIAVGAHGMAAGTPCGL